MPELRAPENSRTGIEIKPKVRYPDQTEAAIVSSLDQFLPEHCVTAFWRKSTQGSSLNHPAHFDAQELCRLSKLKAGGLVGGFGCIYIWCLPL
jgi:hypothetical protein